MSGAYGEPIASKAFHDGDGGRTGGHMPDKSSGSLRQLWERELEDLYPTERRIVSALPELASAATSPQLADALNKHLNRTKIHVERLDLIFKQCGFQSA